MKKLLLISLLALFVFACNSTNKSGGSAESDENKAQSSSDKKYQIESGIIIYKMDMMGMESKSTVYFKDYGKIEASYTETEMMGEKTVIQTLQKDNFYYTFTPGKNTGTKFSMNGQDAVDEAGMHKMSEADVLKGGGKKVGTEKILGKECNIYQLTENGVETKVWIWNNMFLKTVASQNGMAMKLEAVEIKETANFPSGTFEIPKNIKFSTPENNPESDPDFDNKDAKG
jgi:hypothetical protein